NLARGGRRAARLAGARAARSGACLSCPPRRHAAAVEGGAGRPFQRRGHRLTNARRGEGAGMASVAAEAPGHNPTRKEMQLVIAASSAGTVFEWYELFVYGTLAPMIAAAFFPSGNATLSLLLTWAGFALGLV